jgi:DNA-binding NarL/FixJ family response regulator
MGSAPGNSSGSEGLTGRRAGVIVADPYPIVLLGIRKIVEDDPRLELVAEASTLGLLREKVKSETPDVALVDWSMASQDLASTAALLRSDHGTSVVFLTVSEDSQQRRDILRLGARGVLSKYASASQLQSALWQACNGYLPLDMSIAALPATVSDPEHRIQQLTRRERQLIPLVCSGLRNKEIAQQLGIAESTVWHHLTSVFTKLRVEDRLRLATFAYKYGLVVPTVAPGVPPDAGTFGCHPT